MNTSKTDLAITRPSMDVRLHVNILSIKEASRDRKRQA